MKHKNTFDRCLDHMKNCRWKIDNVLPKGAKFDLSKNLLPSSLTYHDLLKDRLNSRQRLTLNHITAKSYLNFFHFVEEFIIIKTHKIAQEKPKGSIAQQAFLEFHYEEIKHQKLFERAIKYIDLDLTPPSKVVDFEKEAAKEILTLHPGAVLLLLFHLEIITQEHYLQAVKNNSQICANFSTILQYHWVDESQHAHLDKIELNDKYANLDEISQIKIIEDFHTSLSSMSDIFKMQAQHDLNSLASLLKCQFDSQVQDEISKIQYYTYVNLFVLNGLQHRAVQKLIYEIFPLGEKKFYHIQQEIQQQRDKLSFF